MSLGEKDYQGQGQNEFSKTRNRRWIFSDSDNSSGVWGDRPPAFRRLEFNKK
jgi:hypothetical protein